MNYDDIIHLPHHVSKTHPPMPRADRAAQFAPFAALTGHEAAIREEARLTGAQIHLTDEHIAYLNTQMAYLADHLDDRPTVRITYFCPDARKSGGAYLTAEGTVHTVDDIEGVIIMDDGKTIPMATVLSIDSDSFPDNDWKI